MSFPQYINSKSKSYNSIWLYSNMLGVNWLSNLPRFFSENDFLLHFKCQYLFGMNIFLSVSVFGKNPGQTLKSEEFCLEMGPTFSSSSTCLKAYIKGKV